MSVGVIYLTVMLIDKLLLAS